VADIVRLCHVTLDGNGAAALGLNHACRVVNGARGIFGERRASRRINLRPGRHHDFGPVPCETQAYRPPNAAAAAGDKRHFVAQCHLFQGAKINLECHSSLPFAFCRAARAG